MNSKQEQETNKDDEKYPHIKVFENFYRADHLTDDVNEYLTAKGIEIDDVIDIKYSSATTYDRVQESTSHYYSAMLIYKRGL